jgi:Domain of unknown function (DUF4384)
MRSIFTVATIAASALLLTAATNLASADDDAATRDLSLEQIKIFKAGSPKQGSLQVTASVDRSDLTYAKGEVMKLQVKVSEDAHVFVYDTGPGGNRILLFPNPLQKDDLIKAGHSVSIPPSDAKVKIKVTGKTGAELITVVASNKPLKWASGVVMSGDEVFMTVKESADEFARDLTLETENADPGKKLSIVQLPIKTVASR